MPANQKILIGKDVVVTILRVQGEQVSVGIDAPKYVQILREEIYLEIQRENAEGLVSKDVDVKDLVKHLKVKPIKFTSQSIGIQKKEEDK